MKEAPLGAGDTLPCVSDALLAEISPYRAPKAEARRARYKLSSEGTVQEL